MHVLPASAGADHRLAVDLGQLKGGLALISDEAHVVICLLVSQVGFVAVLVDGRFSILAVEVAATNGHPLVALELLLGGLPVHQLVLAMVADASTSQTTGPLVRADTTHRHVDANA